MKFYQNLIIKNIIVSNYYEMDRNGKKQRIETYH